ncbi:MAG: hypothetical protein IH944_10780 [Armatimonadetes bacterium]|nr:hypothetical protein [Armatimonadota bacterium]
MRWYFTLAALGVAAVGSAQYVNISGNVNGDVNISFGVQQQRIPWQTVYTGQNCRITQQMTRFIGSQREWEYYWRQANGIHPARRTHVPGGFDWRNEYLVAIHMGTQRSGGFGVWVESVYQSTAGFFDINFVIQQPRRSGYSFGFSYQSWTSPFTIIRVRRGAYQPRYNPRYYAPHRYTPPLACGCGDCHSHKPVYMMMPDGSLAQYEPPHYTPHR